MANLKYGKIGEILDLEILSEININDFLSQENIDNFNLAFYHLRHINDKEKKNGVLKNKKTIIEKEKTITDHGKAIHIEIEESDESLVGSGSVRDIKTDKLLGVMKYDSISKKIVLYIFGEKGLTTFNQKNAHGKVEVEIFSSNSNDKLLIQKQGYKFSVKQRGNKYQYIGPESIEEFEI